MTVQIDKGVPLPSRYSHSRSKYPWDTMEVGDSFLAAPNTNGRSLADAATHSRPGKKFIARMRDGVTRIWRVE